MSSIEQKYGKNFYQRLSQYFPKNLPVPTAFQVALNPLRASLSSLWKMTVILLSELMMGLGLLDPQYLCSSDPNETIT